MDPQHGDSTGIHIGADARVGHLTVQGNVAGGDIVTITEELSYEVGDLQRNPYLGLASYTYETRAYFSGREQQVQDAVGVMTSAGSEPVLVVVTGASGSGKSSFAQAGLVPALEETYVRLGRSFRWSVARPGRHPLAALARALRGLGVDGATDLRGPEDVHYLLATGLPPSQMSVLVLDQFEELFAQSDPDERDTVCAILSQLTSFADVRTHIIATLRADYLPSLFESAALFERVKRDGIELRAMAPDELARAIHRPLQEQARLEGKPKRVQPALVERLVEDVEAGGPGVLPLLQVTLAALWDQPPQRLTVDRYRSLTDALEQHAERAYSRDRHGRNRTPEDQRLLMTILLDLVDVSQDDEAHHDVRRTVTKQELVHGAGQRAALVEELVDARLLSIWVEQRGSASVELVDIIHETLLTNWKRLRSAIDDQRDVLQRRARFRLAVQEWERNGRAEEYLFRGGRLADAREWLTEASIALNTEQVAFVEASQAAESAEQGAAARRARNTIGALIGVLAMISALALFSLSQRQSAVESATTAAYSATQAGYSEGTAIANGLEADRQRQTAEAQASVALENAATAVAERNTAYSRELAASALSVESNDTELSVLLATRAASASTTQEAEVALRQALVRSPVRAILQPSAKRALPLFVYSPDGARLVMGSSSDELFPDRSVDSEIFDTNSHQSIGSLPGAPLGGNQSFSPSGRRILLSSANSDVQVWDFDANGAVLTLPGRNSVIASAAFEPLNGARIATASEDGSVDLWNATTGEREFALANAQSTPEAYEVRFDAEGTRVLARAPGVAPRAWDVTTGREIGPLLATLTSNGIGGSAFSPDGTRVAVAIIDRVEIWSVDEARLLLAIPGDVSQIELAFSPDGSQLSWEDANTVRIWDTSTGAELRRMDLQERSDAGPIPLQGGGVSFSSDGLLVAASRAEAPGVQVWDAATGKPAGFLGLTRELGIGMTVFSPVGHELASPGVTLWHASFGGEALLACCHISSLALNSDNSQLVTLEPNGAARRWDIRSGRSLSLPSAPAVPGGLRIQQPLLSPDGSRLVFWSDDRTLRARDLADGHEVELAQEVAVSDFTVPDGRHVLSLTRAGTLIAWDTTTGNELARLTRTTTNNFSDAPVILAADGVHMLLAGVDMSDASALQTWQAATGWQVVSPPSPASGWNAEKTVSLSRDGSRALTDSVAGAHVQTVQVWDTTSGTILDSMIRFNEYGSNFVSNLTLDADGNRFTTYEEEQDRVTVWDIASHQPVGPPYTNANSAYLSADGTRLITSLKDGSLRLWNVDTGTQLLSMDLHAPVDLISVGAEDRSLLAMEKKSGTAFVFGCEVLCSFKDVMDLAAGRTPRQLTAAEQQTYLHNP